MRSAARTVAADRDVSAHAVRPEAPHLKSLRLQVRQFLGEQRAAGVFQPQCDSWMSAHSPQFSRALGARGWIGMTWPVAEGGGGRSERERLVVNEELLAAGAPVAAHWSADRQVGPALIRSGTAEQRTRYLPGIARGEVFFAIGMSEPDSGSDLASIRTSAIRTADGWSISGRKVWTTHAHAAHQLLTLVRTSPFDPDARHAGMSQIVVAVDAPGVEVNPITTMDGHAHFAEVVFDDVRVPDSAVLGVVGRGWAQVMAELANERSGPERFFSNAPLLFEYLTGPAARNDAEVGILLAEFQTLRTLCSRVADALNDGESPAREAALLKDLGTRFEAKVVDVVRARHPVEPDPASSEPLTRLLAEAIIHGPDTTLRGGTNEILRGIVARSLGQS